MKGKARKTSKTSRASQKRPRAGRRNIAANALENHYDTIFSLIQSHCDIDFSSYKITTVGRRIQRQMGLQKIDSVADYVRFLEANPEAIRLLCEDVFIHVTEFFRDPEAFEALKKLAFPRMLKNRQKGAPLRIWVPGCSTGEEAYSIAIAFLESSPAKSDRVPLQIFATDISEQAVQEARAGYYPEEALAKVPAPLRKKYFEKAKEGYRVKRMLRDLFVFSRHDLMTNPPFAKIDLISCRNVLIYFAAPQQRHVLPVFHYALNRDGILWLGKSESPFGISKLFTLLDGSHKIFSKINTATPMSFRTPTTLPSTARSSAKNGSKPTPPLLDYQKEFDRVVISRYGPSGVVVNADLEILQLRGDNSPYLNLGSGQPNYNLLKLLRPELLPAVRMAFQAAQKKNASVRKEGLGYEFAREHRKVSLEVIPINVHLSPKERQYVVLFDETAPAGGGPAPVAPQRKARSPADDGTYVGELLEELDAMRDYQQSLSEGYEATQEELTSSNEELQSTLEEFQSTNEELETAKEELQASNEELSTVNDELQLRNEELIKAVEDLARSEEKFRQLVDAVKDYAIFMLDPDGNVASWNEGARRIKGYDADEIIGKHFSKFYPPEAVKSRHPQHELEFAKEHGKYEEEGIRVRKDGSAFYAHVLITPIRDKAGNLRGFSKVTRDLTEIRRMEEARRKVELKSAQLQANQGTLDQIFSESPSFMCLTVGPKHVIERANNEYLSVLRLPPSIVGKQVKEVFPGIEEQGFIARLDNAFHSGKTFRAMDAPLVLRQADGSERLIYVTFAYQPVRDSEGKIYGIIHQGFETSDAVLARRNLEAAVRARDEFMSLASHELKTPLTALRLQAQIMRRDLTREPARKSMPEDFIRFTDKLDLQVTRLTRLVDDMLDVTRIESGKLAVVIEDVNLGACVRRVVGNFSGLANSEGKVSLELEDGVEGKWDPYKIEQVITNLFTNALKYGEGRPISIRVYQSRGMAVLEIRDEGKGIREADQQRIFGRFERAVSGSDVSGLGLGLYISKTIVAAHGGSIGVESELGKGAVFTVKLPLDIGVRGT